MKKLFTLLMVSIFCCGMYATTLHVEQLYGADYAVAVKNIGKLVIKGTTLNFYDRKGELLYSTDMNSTRAMTFDVEDSDALETILSGNSERYTVYPNPTSTMVIVNGLKEPVALRLYSLDGQLIKKTVGTSMHMEDVPNGNFLLQCENQMIKIIKQ